MMKPVGAKTREEYLAMLDEPRKSHIKEIDSFIRNCVPGLKPYMISRMLAYGSYHYKGASGREGDWCVVGLASQKNYISIYVCAVNNGQYVAERYKDQLPKASIGRSCIRFKKFEDIDFEVMKKILVEAEQSTERAL